MFAQLVCVTVVLTSMCWFSWKTPRCLRLRCGALCTHGRMPDSGTDADAAHKSVDVVRAGSSPEGDLRLNGRRLSRHHVRRCSTVELPERIPSNGEQIIHRVMTENSLMLMTSFGSERARRDERVTTQDSSSLMTLDSDSGGANFTMESHVADETQGHLHDLEESASGRDSLDREHSLSYT